MIIAVDGTAASGKGTLARRLATHFGLPYLDTGTLYRAVGLKLLDAGRDPTDPEAAAQAAETLTEAERDHPDLRSDRAAVAASQVAAQPRVRAALVDLQRRFAAQPGGAVLDGRDIGTVICPDAPVKLFITAPVEERARRRHRDLAGDQPDMRYETVLEDMRARDARDAGRATAPMAAAADAAHLDTGALDIDQAFDRALEICRRRLGRA